MPASRSDVADFAYFLAIARHRSFRGAAVELGISASALSHALKGFEGRLGIRLFNRTNRSVTLTAAGEQLQTSIAGPFEAIGQALQVLDRFREGPVGRIRLNVLEDAAMTLLAPVLPEFARRYSEIEIDVSIDNRLVDVTEQGFDAGIRYGGTVPADMIAQRLSSGIRWVVAGSPSYLEQFGKPRHPDELMQHRCFRIRLGNDRIYRWEFEKDGEALEASVPGPFTIDETQFARSLALDGAGLMYAPEPTVASDLASGALVEVLSDWAPMGTGFHIYYSSKRHVPVGLRLLIDLIKELQPLA